MEKIELKPGDVVQIDPAHDDVFGGSLMVITEPKSWGAQGYINVPGKGLAYYRCSWEHMEPVGVATWVKDRGDDGAPAAPLAPRSPAHATTPPLGCSWCGAVAGCDCKGGRR